METITETMWKQIFLKKNVIAFARNWFSASEKQFFSPIFQIFLAAKTVFPSSGNVLFNKFLIPASGTDVFFSGNSIPFYSEFC